MKESENEDTDTVLTETLNDLLQEKLTDIDIDRSHWIERLQNTNNQDLSASCLPDITLEIEYLKTRKSWKTLVLA